MTHVLRGATVIDGTGVDPRHGLDVHVTDGTISGLGDAPIGDADVIDLDGLTVLPGLIDAHVHLGISADVGAMTTGRISVAEIAAAIFRNCEQTLDAGFTTVRDVGGIDAGLVRAVDGGMVRGPRILCAGPLLCQTGGHGHFAADWEPTQRWTDHHIPGLWGLSLLADGADGVRQAAREAFRRGASFLKLCVTGGVVSSHDELTDTQFTVDEIRAAVVEAEARGTYVTVHAHNRDGVRNALEAGVKCVEHGTDIDEETAALMAARGVALVPTLAVVQTLAEHSDVIGLPPGIAARVAGVLDRMSSATKIAMAAGVRVGSGSDLIGPNQTFRGLELVLKSELLDPMTALVSATRTNAGILGLSDRLGTVELGKAADLIAIDGDPLADPKLFNQPERVVLVMRDGEIVKDTRGAS